MPLSDKQIMHIGAFLHMVTQMTFVRSVAISMGLHSFINAKRVNFEFMVAVVTDDRNATILVNDPQAISHVKID